MSELIAIKKHEIDGSEVNAVDARELHEFLESRQQFGDWIKKRIKQYGFAKGIDFTRFHKTMKANNTNINTKEYYLTIDMAKELAMVERNDKGKQARQYFIECERLAKGAAVQQPHPMQHLLNAPRSELFLEMARISEENEALEIKIEEDKPKVDFHDALVEADRTYSWKEFAQAICEVKGLKIGRNNLMQFAREYGLLQKNEEHNIPYQRWINAGLFSVELSYVGNPPFQKSVMTTRITTKGLTKLTPIIKKRLRALMGSNQ